LPLILAFAPSFADSYTQSISSLKPLLEYLPKHVQEELKEMNEMQILVYVMLKYFFAPFFLIIPLMVSNVIASDSFAGEKERKTIEALLATPLSDSELFLGKILASFIPSMAVTLVSFLIYAVTANTISFNILNGKLMIPTVTWILLIFGFSPTISIATIGLTVIVSAKVKGVREAQQVSALLLIRILALVFGQAAGAIILGPTITLMLIGIFILIDISTFKISVKIFRREEILSKLS